MVWAGKWTKFTNLAKNIKNIIENGCMNYYNIYETKWYTTELFFMELGNY